MNDETLRVYLTENCIIERKELKETMMNQIFDWCVNVLVYWAGIFGITYKEINVWVFVIIWPILTLILVGIIFIQARIIRRISEERP